jgi:hypothetical protein
MMEQTNTLWEEIVNSAASRLEADYPDLVVSDGAREVLLARVDEHRDALEAELREGRATPETVSEAAYQQLLAAAAGAKRSASRGSEHTSHVIQAPDVVASMQGRCYWIPWC